MFLALICEPVADEASKYVEEPRRVIFAPAVDVTLIEFSSTGTSIVYPVCPLIFRSACLMVSFEKMFDPS